MTTSGFNLEDEGLGFYPELFLQEFDATNKELDETDTYVGETKSTPLLPSTTGSTSSPHHPFGNSPIKLEVDPDFTETALPPISSSDGGGQDMLTGKYRDINISFSLPFS